MVSLNAVTNILVLNKQSKRNKREKLHIWIENKEQQSVTHEKGKDYFP